MQGDVANAADVGRLFKKAVDTFGEINVVVNCAGIMPLSGDLELFDKVISTNLRAGYRGVFRYTLTYCNPICKSK
jgi:3-oxoacyl-[acyl-carrier protein] reductase